MALPKSIQADTGTGGTRTSTPTYTALRYGSTGDPVKKLQTALASGGYYTGSIDGSYGPATEWAVKAYQKKMGLTVDGIAGPQTQGSLYTVKPAATATVVPKTTSTPKPVQQTGIPAVGVPLPEDIARLQGVPTTDPNAVSAAQFDAQMQAIRAQQTATPVPQTGVPIGGTPLPEDIARMQGVRTQPVAPATTVPGAPLPEDVERRKAELAGQVPLHVDKTIQEQQQDIKTDLDAVTTGVIGGGGTGTGGTGGGTSTTGGTTATKTSTGTTIEGEPATDTWQNYYKKATETQFQYNPAEDQEYLRAASVIEQQVTDMMVGRGGLYSSVAHAALQSRLMSLQVDYQKMAYEKFIEEREYNMKIASFLAGREDAAWEKGFKEKEFTASREDEEWNRSFKVAQFKADQEQRAFSNSMQQAQLRISQANAAASRAAAQARAKQAEAQNTLAMMRVNYQMDYDKNEEMINKWRKRGSADYEIASYFNVPLNAEPSGTYGNRIEQSLYRFEAEAQKIVNYAQSIGDAQATLDMYNSFREESKPVDYNVAYNDTMTQIAEAKQAGLSYSEILDGFLADSSSYKDYNGPANYSKVLSYLTSQVDKDNR